MPNESFLTLDGEGSFSFTEKKSVFTGYASYAGNEAEALAFISKIKLENAGARHCVSAYFCSGVPHASDDGEPQGTGGMPVLNTITKNGLNNTAVVVARYFGGILLGAGGLVRAYSRAAAGALGNARTVRFERICDCAFKCGYGDYERLLCELSKFRTSVGGTDFQLEVTVNFSVCAAELDSLCRRISDMTCGGVTVFPKNERFGIIK